VFDPLNDPPPQTPKSWKERKVGCKALVPDIAGTWTGDAKSETGEAENITVKITQSWIQRWIPPSGVYYLGGVSALTWDMDANGFLSVMMPFRKPEFCMLSEAFAQFFMPTGEQEVTFRNLTPDTLGMEVLKDISLGGSGRRVDKVWTAILRQVTIGTPPPIPDDFSLLLFVNRQVPSSWSDQRQADARLIFDALDAWKVPMGTTPFSS
jgi:hypothetical protein